MFGSRSPKLRRARARTSSLWSLVKSTLVADVPRLAQRESRAAFVGDVLRSPVHGRVGSVSVDGTTVTFETACYLPHAIVSPVKGKLIRVEAMNGALCNGLFVADREKESCLVLHIICSKSAQTIELRIVAKPHGATSRMRLSVPLYSFVYDGQVLAYAGGTFETRLTLPVTSFVGVARLAVVHGKSTVIGNVYRTV